MGATLVGLPLILWGAMSFAQEQLPWQRPAPADDAYDPQGKDYTRPNNGSARPNDAYSPPPRYGQGSAPPNDAYSPPPRYGQAPANNGYGQAYEPPPGERAYRPPQTPNYSGGQQPPYAGQQTEGYNRPSSGYGRPYTDPPPPREREYAGPGYDERYGRSYDGRPYDERDDRSYSSNEILNAGHQFFGSVSKGLASVVEYAFRKQGRPNGYILGQDAGGAFVAGLRYGEGMLYTKDTGTHRIYWQGPSIGWDAGAEGSKVMVLVYNLRSPEDIYRRFGGVDGSAYFVGGVGLTFLTSDDLVVAPIRSGVGLRLGANIGYLKYTHRPTWNPF